ncbi:MAG: hypothetical protein OHK0023_12280 [Anaerolineae bacterium]
MGNLRRGILYAISRLIVLLVAVVAYLLLLPIEISTANGLSIRFPDLIRFEGEGLAYPEPINWNYLLLLPVMLIIIFIGFEALRLIFRRDRYY